MEINMAFQHILLNVELILTLIIICTVKFAKNDTDDVWNDIQPYLQPLHYNVEMEFVGYTNVFMGKCNVTIQINRPTTYITIKKSKMFDITAIDMVTLQNYEINNIQNFSLINETSIHLNFTQPIGILFPGIYRLIYFYNYSMLDDVYFFNPYYTKLSESTKVIKAKQLFLHWDKPIFKSTFNISILHHKSYKLLSNMPIREKAVYEEDLLWTHFHESPLMSAQDLTIVAINTDTAINIVTTFPGTKFWCAKKKVDQMRFAGRIFEEVIYFLAQKAKKVPIIQYIVVKAFQHSNVKIKEFILLREKDIIYENTSDRISDKIKVANLIAHHTISYWHNDVLLWSKEGFITFLAAHILSQTHAINRMTDLFVVQTQQESLRIESLFNMDSYLLHTNISAVHSFESPFDYTKASVIWRMLHHLISDYVFWIAIHTHRIFSFTNELNELETVQTDKLWNIMQHLLNDNGNLHNTDIKNTLDNWIIEHPQLMVEQIYKNKTIFKYINPEFDKNAKYSTLVTYTTKFNEPKSFWLNQEESFWPVSKKFDQNDWIIVNLQLTGYYRVNYNIENWRNLTHYLYYENVTGIHVLNRAQIIDDAFYFFMQRQLTYNMFWNITSFLFNDTDYIAWYPMIKAVEYMMCIEQVQNITKIKDTLKEMFHKLLLNIGYDEKSDESDFTKCLREEAIKWACILDAPRCREIAAIKLNEHFEKSKQLNKLIDLKGKESMYCKGLMPGDYGIWLKVYELPETSTQDTLTKLYSLICCPQPDVIQAYLQMTMYNECAVTEKTSRKMCANIVLLIAARHAKNDTVLYEIFEKLQSIKFSSKKKTDDIVTLIVIITHEHNVEQFNKITEFVKNNMTMSDKRLVHAVEQKIKKRQNEYARLVTKYEILSKN